MIIYLDFAWHLILYLLMQDSQNPNDRMKMDAHR